MLVMHNCDSSDVVLRFFMILLNGFLLRSCDGSIRRTTYIVQYSTVLRLYVQHSTVAYCSSTYLEKNKKKPLMG